MKNYDFILYIIFLYYVCYNIIDLILLLRSNKKISKKRKTISMHDMNLNRYQDSLPSFSIIIPFYNESENMIQCIYSAINQNYEKKEIILVNDGSSNDIESLIICHFEMSQINVSDNNKNHQLFASKQFPNLFLLNKQNSGKADSLNIASKYAKKEFLLFLDADTFLRKNAISRFAQYIMQDTNKYHIYGPIIGINNDVEYKRGDIVKTQPHKGFLATLQEIEYLSSFFIHRLGFTSMKGNFIVSGACLVMKKFKFIEVGGFDPNTITEDLELCLRTLKFTNNDEYPIYYVPEVLCDTEVPFRVDHLIAQRKRWYWGMFANLWNYKFDLLFNKTSANSILSILYYLVFILPNPFIYFFSIVISFISLNTESFLMYNFIILTMNTAYILLTLFIYFLKINKQFTLQEIVIKYLYSIIIQLTLTPLDKFINVIAYVKLFSRKDWGKTERIEKSIFEIN